MLIIQLKNSAKLWRDEVLGTAMGRVLVHIGVFREAWLLQQFLHRSVYILRPGILPFLQHMSEKDECETWWPKGSYPSETPKKLIISRMNVHFSINSVSHCTTLGPTEKNN